MPTDTPIEPHIDSLTAELSLIDRKILEKYPIETYLRIIRSLPELWLYREFPFRLESVFRKILLRHGVHALALYHKLALACFIRDAKTDLPRMRMPESVLPLYREWFDRVIEDFSGNPDDFYDHEKDLFCKDLGVCSLRMTPVGCEVTETIGLGRRHFFTGGPKQFLRYFHYTILKTSGFHPLYAIHLDMRYLSQFNPEGQDRVYLRIAEMLKLNPRIKGLFGISWFFDPVLEEISPRLTYLRRRPARRGAAIFRAGASERDARLATLKSQTRRRLYREGLYKPTGYMMLWPRKEMIEWAERHRWTAPGQMTDARIADAISSLSGELSREDGAVLEEHPLRTYIDIVRSYTPGHFYRNTHPALAASFDAIREARGVRVLALYQKLAMAHFIRNSIEELEDMGLPRRVFDLYHEWFARIVGDFGRQPDDFYDYRKDQFCKDLAVCGLRLIPVGFLIEASGIGSKFLFSGGAGQFLDGLGYLVREMKGLKPFYSVHLDMRYLKRYFSVRGWSECYLNIADMLERYPRMKGMIGGSWFYDPQLEQVSPGLAHLRTVPESFGGKVYRIGTSEQDLRLAAANSPQRTKLILEGKYRPVHYVIIWPRDGMLEWARRNRMKEPRGD